MRRPARFSVRLDRALQPRPPAGGSGRQAQAHLLAACVRVAVPRPPLLTHPTPPPPVPTLCHQGGGGAGALARLAAQRQRVCLEGHASRHAPVPPPQLTCCCPAGARHLPTRQRAPAHVGAAPAPRGHSPPSAAQPAAACAADADVVACPGAQRWRGLSSCLAQWRAVPLPAQAWCLHASTRAALPVSSARPCHPAWL